MKTKISDKNVILQSKDIPKNEPAQKSSKSLKHKIKEEIADLKNYISY
jgi:hypothetical protein